MSVNTREGRNRKGRERTEAPPSARRLAELERAYRRADYDLDTGDGPRSLQIGQPAEDVAAWMAARGLQRLVLLTAWNPGSRPLTDAQNTRRQRRLEQAVAESGLRVWPARNRDPDGQWPDEPALAIADLPDDLLAGWLEAFGQNAAVLLEPPAPPRLVWHPALAR